MSKRLAGPCKFCAKQELMDDEGHVYCMWCGENQDKEIKPPVFTERHQWGYHADKLIGQLRTLIEDCDDSKTGKWFKITITEEG